MPEHIAIIKPDDRGRFNLGKVLDRTPGLRWKLFVDADGRGARLEAVAE